MQRETVSLKGPWHFQVDVSDLGEKRNWFDPGYPHAEWAQVTVPQAWDCFEEALWGYEGVGWYRTIIAPQKTAAGDRFILHFGRVNYHTRLWINGTLAGEHCNGYIPFELDISEYAATGEPLTLVLRVDNKPKQGWLPGTPVIEWIQYGGILQPVQLEKTGAIHIARFDLTAEPEGPGGTFSCAAAVSNTSDRSWSGALTLTVSGDGKTANKTVERLTVPAGTLQEISLSLSFEKARHWTPDSPVLYTAGLDLKTDGKTIDRVTKRTGLRSIRIRGTEILLNGRVMRIKGVNRYDDMGRYGPTPPPELIRDDLRLIKETGINLIRTHYPQAPFLLDLFDEMGLMHMAEVPVNWWGCKHWENRTVPDATVREPATRTLDAIIRRDIHHPCVIAWSMANESATDHPVGIDMMKKLMAHARAADPSRLVTFVVAGDSKDHQAFKEADLVCSNYYPGLFSGEECQHTGDVHETVRRPMEAHLRKQVSNFPGKPVVLTEFGITAIAGLSGAEAYSENIQAAVLGQILAAMEGVPGVAGGVLWSWADYYHRRDLIRYAPFGPYGVVTTDRRHKAGLAVLRQAWNNKPGQTGRPANALNRR